MNYSRKNRSRRGGGVLHFKPVTLNGVTHKDIKVMENEDSGKFYLVNGNYEQGQEVYPDNVDDPKQFFDVPQGTGGRRRKSRRRKCKSKRKRR